jgi:hypothetical protein
MGGLYRRRPVALEQKWMVRASKDKATTGQTKRIIAAGTRGILMRFYQEMPVKEQKQFFVRIKWGDTKKILWDHRWEGRDGIVLDRHY